MMALSLWQPWAQLCVLGDKRIETRSWCTSYRGPLLIHAALKTTHELIELCHEEPFRTALRSAGITRWQDLPRGAVIGKVELVDCQRIAGEYMPTSAGLSEFHEEPDDDGMAPPPLPERAFGNYEPGRFAWLLDNPQRFTEPVLYRARQRLFNIPPQSLGFT